MFFLKLTSRFILRRIFKSIIVLMVSLILVLFLTFYANAVDTQLRTLDELYKTIEVSAHMTSWDGSSTTNLNISEYFITVLLDSGFIYQEFYTRNLLYLTEPWDEENSQLTIYQHSSKLVGANDIAAIPDFSHVKSTMPNFLNGYDKTLFRSSENIAVVSTNFLEANDLILGDEINLTVVEDSEYLQPQYLSYGAVTLKIVGHYDSLHAENPIYIPWYTMTEIYNDLDISPKWDSASYILQDTQNLDQLRELLKSHNFNYQGQKAEERDPFKPGFIIQDEILNTAIGSVSNYVDFMKALYPVIYALCVIIGFLVSYLLIKIRKPEYAIMRSLGTSRFKTFFIFFLEQSFLSILPVSLGLTITYLIIGTITLMQTYSIIGYLISYWVGTAIAILMMSSGSVVQILSTKE